MSTMFKQRWLEMSYSMPYWAVYLMNVSPAILQSFIRNILVSGCSSIIGGWQGAKDAEIDKPGAWTLGLYHYLIHNLVGGCSSPSQYVDENKSLRYLSNFT